MHVYRVAVGPLTFGTKNIVRENCGCGCNERENVISFSASRADAHVGHQSHHLKPGKIPDYWRVGTTKIITVKDHRTSRLSARHVCHLSGKQSCTCATSLSKLEKQTELQRRPPYFLILLHLLHDTELLLMHHATDNILE